MNTSRNQSKVMAIALRAAVKALRDRPIRNWTDLVADPDRDNALESIDVIAEELEAIADSRLMCSASMGRKGRCPNAATKVYGYNRLGVKGELPRCDRHPLGNATHERVIAAAPDPDGGPNGR